MIVLPGYEKYNLLEPISIDVSNWKKSLDIAALAGFDDVPKFIPTEVLMAKLYANKNEILFTGTMRPKQRTEPVPTFSIAEVTLIVSYQWGSSTTLDYAPTGTFNGTFAIKALLQQPKGARFGWPTQLTGEIAYSSNPPGWVLSGTVTNLYASTLAQFFGGDESIQTAVLPILESIRIEYLNITYQYTKQEASYFKITGKLLIGSHRFTLEFEHNGSDNWKFIATAQSKDNRQVKSTVSELVSSVAGFEVELPEFISNISIEINNENRMDLIIQKSKQSPDAASTENSMVIILTIQLGNFTVRYIQAREVVPTALASVTPTQRVLTTSVKGFDEVEIPMVGNIPQPFDKALFMWAPKGQSSSTGFSKKQLDAVNQTLSNLDQSPIPYKPIKRGKPQPNDVILLHGMHFMLMRKGTDGPDTVALDYTFNRSRKSKVLVNEPTVEDNGSVMAPYERGVGPLSIKNIGFKYSTGTSGKDSILAIRLDAYAKIGPVEFALLGLTLGLNFKAERGPWSLHNLPPLEVGLEGLQAGFQRPPIEIAGMLQHKHTAEEDSFAGALVIGLTPWRFQAAGYYGTVKKGSAPDDTMETFFLYCLLQGPLITFGYASIEGICGGFGYNSNLTFPTPQNVTKFPLINGSKSAPDPDGPPDGILGHLLATTWFSPKDGSFWVAAGLTVKAFEILSVQAVLVVQWNPEVEIGIFGLATASIPGGKSTRQFAYVELGITATLSFRTGVLKIEGELTPASYILDPSCHLEGGFALYTWFDDKGENSELKGDWVFTIGGFHPMYTKPSHYPNPPRLGISWQFGKSISISGQAYFAITPKVCMGGGRLDVTLSLNPLFAYFNAFVDFLINYKPFFFIAEGGLTVGVRFTLDLWLVSINIKVEIGARLYIEGPPIRGLVHVDFWVFGFDVNFGEENKPEPKALSLDEFIDVVCQSSNTGMPSLDSLPAPTNVESHQVYVFSVHEGLIPTNKAKSTPSSGDLWKVRAATFEFSVTSKFAFNEAIVTTPRSEGDKNIAVPGTDGEIYAKPMYSTSPISSKLHITITPETPSVLDEQPSTEPLWDSNSSIRKDVPVALWGKCRFYLLSFIHPVSFGKANAITDDSASDPSHNKNPSSLLNGTKDKTVNLAMGVHIIKPHPLPSVDNTVPFNVEKFQILSLPAEKPVAVPNKPTKAFEPLPDMGTQQWEAVKTVYNEKEQTAATAVELFKSIGISKLGWTEKKIKSATGVLTGSKPKKIVNDLPKYYLWAPLLSGK